LGGSSLGAGKNIVGTSILLAHEECARASFKRRAGCTARKIEKGSFDVRAVYISIFANNAVAIWWVWRVEKNPNIKDVF
jgi:hypothetical protein